MFPSLRCSRYSSVLGCKYKIRTLLQVQQKIHKSRNTVKSDLLAQSKGQFRLRTSCLNWAPPPPQNVRQALQVKIDPVYHMDSQVWSRAHVIEFLKVVALLCTFFFYFSLNLIVSQSYLQSWLFFLLLDLVY
jgi:hypothetical protein